MNFYRKYFQNSIRRKILLFFVMSFFTMSLFIFFFIQEYSKEHFYKLSESQYLANLGSERNVFDQYLTEKIRPLDDLINRVEWMHEKYQTGRYDSEFVYKEQILEDLEFLQSNTRVYESLYLITPDRHLYIFPALELEVSSMKISQEQYDELLEEKFILTSKNRLSRRTGTSVIDVSRKIKHNEVIYGIIGGTINLNELSRDFLASFEKPKDYNFVASDGKIIVALDESFIMQDTDFDFSKITSDAGKFTLGKENYFYSKLSKISDSYLISKIDDETLYGGIDRLLLIIFHILMLFLVALLLLTFLGIKKITDPLISLKNAMDEAKNGDFYARAQKLTDDEIGQAADSFNILMDRIRTLTFFDALTNLPNYEQFKYWFSQSIKVKDADHWSYSFVIISINDFKKINEAYGVDAGDQLIIQVANRLKNFQKRFPSLLFLSRFSGDEFLLFYKNIESREKLEDEVQILLKHLNTPYLHKGSNIFLRLVAGGTFCDVCYSNLDYQMSVASNARSMAKKEKLDYFVVSNKESLIQGLADVKNLENDLFEALEKGHLQVYYQPIYNVKAKKFLCLEALLRYQHPERGLISPLDFIPLAEEMGIIDQITVFVIDRALKDMHKLETMGYGKFDIHINISPVHMNKECFVSDICNTVSNHKFNPKRVWLEITEDIALYDFGRQEAKLLELKEKGIHISIDDFGTGYSSFLYVNQLSADQLKIDKSFVINMMKNPRDLEIIKTISTLGQSLGIDLVAEGVEDLESADLLSQLGINKLQGFYFALPMKIEDLEVFFKKKNEE